MTRFKEALNELKRKCDEAKFSDLHVQRQEAALRKAAKTRAAKKKPKKKKNYPGARSPEQRMQDMAHSSDNSPRRHGPDELTADQIKVGETRRRRMAAVAAARESLIEALKERCWKGYEPTPGKKAYSKGSCKPKGKKKKK